MIQLYFKEHQHWLLTTCLCLTSLISFGQTSLFDDAVSSGTIWHSNGAEITNPLNNSDNSSSTVIANNGAGAWEETQIFPNTYTIASGDKLYISFYNPNGASSWQLKMSLSTTGENAYIGDYSHDAGANSTWVEVSVDLSSYAGEDLSKITIYPAGGESKIVYYDYIYFNSNSNSGNTSNLSFTNLFDDAVASGTIWHSNGTEINNPKVDRNNSSSTVIQNNGAGSWEETQLFPDTYTIQTGDKLFISFYNPNGASSWQLKMSLSTAGADKYIGDYNHESPAADGWNESVIDLSNYSGQDITKITIYPAGGEAKSIYYDQLYIGNASISGATNLFRDNAVLGLWNSDGGLVNNPQKDAINYSDQVIVNNGSGGWKDTQWFPNYKIQSGDKFYISFYNPNGAAAMQLRMDLSSTGSFTWIGEPNHDANAANGWVEMALDLNSYAGEIITKIQLYSSAGEAIQIYFDNIYFSSSSHQSNYWTGTSSSDWAIANNWEGSFVPSTLSNVSINTSSNLPLITGNVVVNNLNLDADLSVNSGSLTINGNMSGSANLVVESGASLLTMDGNVIGTTTIKRNTRYVDGRYSMVGTPVGQDANIIGSNLGSHVYKYDETIGYDADAGLSRWLNASADELVPGMGYSQANQEIISFTGIPNSGTITISGLTKTTVGTSSVNDQGWHLLSNPYPAAINVETFLSDNGLSSIAIWDDPNSGLGRGDNGDFLTANSIGVVAGPNGGSFNGYLGSTQGFFVQVNTDNATVEFNENQRIIGNNDDANFFRKADKIATLKLALEGEFYNEVLFGFLEDATHDVDPKYDATKLIGNDNIAFYSLIGDRQFAIQGLPNITSEMTIDLGFFLKKAANYNLTVKDNSGIPTGYHIIASYEGQSFDLTDGNMSLNLPAGTGNIQLLLSETSILSNITEHKMSVYNSNGKLSIWVEKPLLNAYISIFDLTGRNIVSKSNQDFADGLWTENLNLKQGQVYIVKVVSANGVLSRKFIF